MPEETLLTVGTTFSGIGAPEQALKNLNIPHKVKWACDIDKKAKTTYQANHQAEKFYDDITTIDLNSLDYVDLYVFGFPCQDVSTAGKQNLSGGRTVLVNYSLDIIDKIQPKYIIFENVKGLLNSKFQPFFDYILQRLSGYKLKYKVLNSLDYGQVPQNRERVFCVGIRKDLDQEFIFPDKLPRIELQDILEPETDIPATARIPDDKLEKIKGYKRWGTHIGSTSTKHCPCLCAVGKSDVLVLEDKKRILTQKECLRLQGFPDDFVFSVTLNQSYKQLGNSITVKVLERLLVNLIR